jgi:hypothetical protein
MKKRTLERLIHASHAVAMASPGVGGRNHNNFRIGAVLSDGPIILSSKFNSYKTDAKLLPFYKFPFSHAESSCILGVGLDNCEGKCLVVTRIKKDGSVGLAKPCGECQTLIGKVGIKRVWYSTEEGNYDTL